MSGLFTCCMGVPDVSEEDVAVSRNTVMGLLSEPYVVKSPALLHQLQNEDTSLKSLPSLAEASESTSGSRNTFNHAPNIEGDLALDRIEAVVEADHLSVRSNTAAAAPKASDPVEEPTFVASTLASPEEDKVTTPSPDPLAPSPTEDEAIVGGGLDVENDTGRRGGRGKRGGARGGRGRGRLGSISGRGGMRMGSIGGEGVSDVICIPVTGHLQSFIQSDHEKIVSVGEPSLPDKAKLMECAKTAEAILSSGSPTLSYYSRPRSLVTPVILGSSEGLKTISATVPSSPHESFLLHSGRITDIQLGSTALSSPARAAVLSQDLFITAHKPHINNAIYVEHMATGELLRRDWLVAGSPTQAHEFTWALKMIKWMQQ